MLFDDPLSCHAFVSVILNLEINLSLHEGKVCVLSNIQGNEGTDNGKESISQIIKHYIY